MTPKRMTTPLPQLYPSFSIHRGWEPRSSQIPRRLCYVGQDQYFFAPLHETIQKYDHLYSDSATSCVIAIARGQGPDAKEYVAMTHLSSPQRTHVFFGWFDTWFCGGVRLWVQGANPPSAPSSQDNAHALQTWVTTHSSDNRHVEDLHPAQDHKHSWFLEQAELFLLEGHPQEHNRGDWGLDLQTGTVGNRAFLLSHEQRDPSDGVSMLFSMYGSHLLRWPPLWNVLEPYPEEMIRRLVRIAKLQGWHHVAGFSSAEILNTCSTTPEYEPPWFVESIRQSARFVANYRSD